MADWCDLAEEAAVLDDFIGVRYITELTESAVLNDAESGNGPGLLVSDGAVLNDAISQLSVARNNFVERAVLDDHIKVVDTLLIAEAAVLNDAVANVIEGLNLVEAAVLNDAVAQGATKTSLAAEAAVLNDALLGPLSMNIVESAVLNDSSGDFRLVFGDLEESAVLSDHLTGPLFDRLSEAAVLDDASTQILDGYNLAPEQEYIYDAVTGGGAGVAWRTNLDTLPMSRYDNQPWTSMANVGGTVYMTTPDGLYKLDGDDDIGTAIAASITHDLSSKVVGKDGKMADDPHIKRPRDIYLNYISDGALTFSLGYILGTAEQSASYAIPQSTANQFVNGRAKLGRGIRSAHLRPSIANVAGSYFTLNNGTVLLDVLERRI